MAVSTAGPVVGGARSVGRDESGHAPVVLVVDDDRGLRALVHEILGARGFRSVEVDSGESALRVAADLRPDVVLLDLGLPDRGGLDVLVDLVTMGPGPVVVLSGRSSATDRVVGLDLGADDYITKPFSARELVARLNAVLRRTRVSDRPAPLRFGDLSIDEVAHRVTVADRRVDLTPKEFALVSFLARSPRQVFTRPQLLRQVWHSSTEWQQEATVTEHLHRLRMKLDAHHRERWIQTVRGVGYRFDPEGALTAVG